MYAVYGTYPVDQQLATDGAGWGSWTDAGYFGDPGDPNSSTTDVYLYTTDTDSYASSDALTTLGAAYGQGALNNGYPYLSWE
jgi:hypothetical protein